jgi:hypothetical protein
MLWLVRIKLEAQCQIKQYYILIFVLYKESQISLNNLT